MVSTVSLADFQQAQSPEYLSGPNNIRYAGVDQSYAWSLLTRGKGFEQMTHGSDEIREKVMLSNNNNFQNYGPYQALTPSQSQTVTTASARMRFGAYNYMWSKEEELLNGGSADFSPEARVMKYFSFLEKKETEFAYTAAEGIEQSMFAVPDKTTMEDTSGLAPMSFFATFNDHASNLFNNITGTGAFTTRYTIDPTLGGKKLFRRRLFGYTDPGVAPTGGKKNMLGALDKAHIHLDFKRPFVPNSSTRNWEDAGWNRKIGLTSLTGVEKLMELCRFRNDNWGNTQTLGLMGNLNYSGMEIFGIPAMETAAVYHSDYGTPATLVTEGASTTNVGPRIALVDTEAFKILFHAERMFAREKPRTLDNQPFVNVVWGNVYYQFFCAYPHLCGVIAPGTVTGSFKGGDEALTTTNGTVYGAY